MADPGMGHMKTELAMVLRGDSRTHRFLRSRLAFLLLSTLALDVVATALMYLFEHDARFLELWAISVVATAAASIAAFFHARHLEQT
jgi:hypothetical protein